MTLRTHNTLELMNSLAVALAGNPEVMKSLMTHAEVKNLEIAGAAVAHLAAHIAAGVARRENTAITIATLEDQGAA